MKNRTLYALILLAAAALPAQQQQQQRQQRDLRYEDEKPAAEAKPAAVTIPRSYALIIGVAQYQNLPAEAQLRYSERDAEAIYSILISPEGGNFRAENVHKLVGQRATLVNVKKEIEQWLPSVAKDDDRVLIYFAGHAGQREEGDRTVVALRRQGG